MERNTKVFVKLGVGILILTTVSGCKPLFDLFKGKSEEKAKTVEVEEVEVSTPSVSTGAVLLNIDGKPALRESDFDKHLNQMLQMNPYFRGASAESLPMQIKRKFFDELIKQEIILAWANQNNVAQDPEFIKSFEEMKNLVKRSLLVQRFESKIFDGIKVSDKEISDYFNSNKEKFVKEEGGVLLSGIKFTDKEKAAAFYDEVENKKSDFVELAKKADAKNFTDFGRISKDQKTPELVEVPALIKEKALALSNLPAVEKITVGRNIWVVYVSGKTEPQYFSIEEVKPQLESMLKNNKFRDAIEEKVQGIRGDFTVDINEDFFKEGDVKAEQKEEIVKEISPAAAA